MQLSLEEAVAACDASIEQVEEHAHAEWLAAAMLAVRDLARHNDTFTTDQVWELLELDNVATHEPRAMGAVMRRASKDGLIEATGNYVKSARPECHARPVPVWSSRVRS